MDTGLFIDHRVTRQKIANLAVSSYSTSIYLTKIKKLLKDGYNFKEIIIFIDLSDLTDDTLCYEVIENQKVVRRSTFLNCFDNFNSKESKLNNFLSFEIFNNSFLK